MITEYRVLGGLGICAGILGLVAGFNCAVFRAPAPLTIGITMLAVGALTFGCTHYAHGKGYSWLLGLTALCPPVGLVLVCLLPDRCPQEPDAAMRQAHEAKQRSKNSTQRRQ